MNSNAKFTWPSGKSSAIMLAESIIDPAICDGLIGECKKYYDSLFSPGPVFSGLMPSIKFCMDMDFIKDEIESHGVPSALFSYYEENIVKSLFSAIGYYRESFRWLWDWPGLSDSSFRLQHYEKNQGYYREHIDGGPGPLKAKGRMLGAIIYLNTVDLGGETFFREHDLRIPARQGSIALFPAYWTHPHQGCVPISDDKWIISTFIHREIEEEEYVSVTQMPQVVNEEIL